jgi:hypothetical protein
VSATPRRGNFGARDIFDIVLTMNEKFYRSAAGLQTGV